MDVPFGFKQFRFDGCLSYCIHDPATRQAAIIDPVVNLMEEYRSFIMQQGLKPIAVIDTHTHEDHFSASHLFKSAYHSEISMSHRTTGARSTSPLKSGDRIGLGALGLEVLETPGHAQDAIGLVLNFSAGRMLFSGDTLLIGSTGETSGPSGNSSLLWSSLQDLFRKLPDDTLVFPGHDRNDLLFSVLGHEQKKILDTSQGTLDQFLSLKLAENPFLTKDESKAIIQFNLDPSPAEVPYAGPSGRRTPIQDERTIEVGVSSISVGKFSNKLDRRDSSTAYIDVRERDEFREGHMPGCENVPLSELGFHLAELKQKSRIYLVCQTGRRSGMAAKTLTYLGFPDAVNVDGGLKAWIGNGFPVDL